MGVSVNPTLSGVTNVADSIAKSPAAKVMVNADVLFTIVGDIEILSLVSECYTANDGTASTLQYSYTNSGTATSQTLSIASGSLASKGIGTTVSLAATSALTEAPVISANVSGAAVLVNSPRGIRVTTGTITAVIGVGSTTGTWKHYLKYQPLEAGAYAY